MTTISSLQPVSSPSNEYDCEVRSLVPSDGFAVQTILHAAWRQRYVVPGLMPDNLLRVFVQPHNPSYVAAQERRIDNALLDQEAGIVTAAHYVGIQPHGSPDPAGFIKYYLRPPKQQTDAPADTLELYVESLNIHPDVQNRHYGTMLLLVAAAHAEQNVVEEITLDVVMRNVLARLFYYHSGFREGEPYTAFPGSNKLPSMNRIRERGAVHEVIKRLGKRLYLASVPA